MNTATTILITIVRLLPFRLLRILAAGIGHMMWLFKAGPARVAYANIQWCLPELNAKQQIALARASTVEAAITAAELFKVWSMPTDYVLGRVVAVRGENLYRDALDDERGLILVSPHLGNWEVVGLYIAVQAAATSLYAPIKNAVIDQMVKISRSATGAALVPTDISGVKALLKALKQGQQAGILPDQKADEGSGLYSPFFGQQAYTMTLIAALRNKTQARVLMTFAERVSDGWVIHFVEPDPQINNQDLQLAVDALNRSVETCVRMAPSQYQWEYKRFSKQLDGSNPYDSLKR